MDPRYYGLVELVLSGGAVLAIAFWQLWSVNRDQKNDRDRKD